MLAHLDAHLVLGLQKHASVRQSEVSTLLEYIMKGNYLAALHQTICGRTLLYTVRDAFQVPDSPETLLARLSTKLDSLAKDEIESMTLILLGIAAQLAFTQVNYAGLPLPAPSEEEQNLATGVLLDLLDERHRDTATAALSQNGEDIYNCVHFPQLLLISRCTLFGSSLSRVISSTTSDVWRVDGLIPWLVRVLSLHQDALLDTTADMRKDIMTLLPYIAKCTNIKELNPEAEPVGLSQRFSSMTDTSPTPSFPSSSPSPSSSSSTSSLPHLGGLVEASSLPPSTSDPSTIRTRMVQASLSLEASKLVRQYWMYSPSEVLIDKAQVRGFESIYIPYLFFIVFIYY